MEEYFEKVIEDVNKLKQQKIEDLNKIYEDHDKYMRKNEDACRKFIEISRKILNISPDSLYQVLKQYNMSTSFIKSTANGINFPNEQQVDITMKMPPYQIVEETLARLNDRMNILSTGLPPNVRERINPLENSEILPIRAQNDMNLSVLPNFVNTELIFRLEKGDKVVAKKFRDAVFHRGKTLVLIQANRGHVFGGYSPIPWTEGAESNNWKATDEAFIFTLTDNKGREPLQLRVKKERKETALFHSRISFGFGSGHDLGINLIDLKRSESVIFGYQMPENCTTD